MSQLEELLARSRAPGDFVERKRFTLSREKAVEKQREYALRSPQQYILELIQAAVLSGASYIAVDLRPESILVAFVGGRVIQQEELESILDYLFADRGDPRFRHLVQIAIGINALLQRKPKRIRMESGDGDNGVRLDLDPSGKGELGRPQDAISGTYLLMERRMPWLARLRQPAIYPEQKLVEEACTHLPVPIIINGKAPFGYSARRKLKLYGVASQRFFDQGELRGVVGLNPRPDQPPVFQIVVGGCEIVRLELPEVGSLQGDRRSFHGVLCDDRLRKTADQADVVRDARFSRALRALQDQVRLLVQEQLPDRQLVQVPVPLSAGELEEEEQAPELAPVGERLPCLGPGDGVAVSLLEACAGEPLFWMEPGELGRLADLADPARFPFRVLLISEAEARSLHRLVPELSLQRLGSAADLEFVQRVLTREHPVHALSVPVSEEALQGELVLRFHGQGPLPGWGEPGQLPVCVSRGGRALSLSSFSLPIPGVSAELRLQGGLDEELAWMGVLTRLVQAELWRLVASLDPLDPGSQGLLASLLGQQARIRVGRGEEERLEVHAALPPEWGPTGLALVDRPLDGRGLSLRGFLDALGAGEVTPLPAELRARLGPLLERLGGGWSAPEGAQLLALVGLEDGQWFPGHAGERAWVAAGEAPGPLEAGEGWQVVPGPVAGTWRAWWGAEPDWAGAWETLLEVWPPRRHAHRRWALEAALGRPVDPVVTSSMGEDARTVSAWTEVETVCFAAAGGVLPPQPELILLPALELLTLERLTGRRLPLRLDDAPEVWASLVDPQPGQWLLRQPLSVAGVRGWLGLRVPFDATGGVLLRDPDGGWAVLPDLDARLPCHGLVWITDSRPALSEAQQELLGLAALQLYQRLATGLRARRVGEQTEHARRYAMHFCVLASQQGRGHLGTVRLLAAGVVLEDAQGQRWGTLDAWLDAAPEARPALPIPLPRARRVLPERRVSGELVRSIQELGQQAELGVPLQVHWLEKARGPAVTRASAGGVSLGLNRLHPVVTKAAAGPGVARQLLLLEVTRQIACGLEELGLPGGLAELQQVLLARRLGLS